MSVTLVAVIPRLCVIQNCVKAGKSRFYVRVHNTLKIHHNTSSTEIVVGEDDVDVGLEQRLQFIRQSDRLEKEQSSNEVKEEVSDECP